MNDQAQLPIPARPALTADQLSTALCARRILERLRDGRKAEISVSDDDGGEEVWLLDPATPSEATMLQALREYFELELRALGLEP